MVVHPPSCGIPRVPQYSGTDYADFASHTGLLPSLVSVFHPLILLAPSVNVVSPYPNQPKLFGLASSAFARHYLRNLV